MAAAEDNHSWVDLQRMREERMRFEVLDLLHRAAEGRQDQEVNAWGIAVDLGIWHAELFRVVEWLERNGFLRYCGAGPTVCLTPAGVHFVELGAGGRRSIRDPRQD